MPDDGPALRRWPALLAHRLGSGASAAQVAETVASLWLDIDAALHPIIGHRGVAALYHRSLKLGASSYPWLLQGHPGLLPRVGPQALQAALAAQTPDTANAAAELLFQAFLDLLTSLVGASLTDRLLRSVWAPPSGAAPTQDSKA